MEDILPIPEIEDPIPNEMPPEKVDWSRMIFMFLLGSLLGVLFFGALIFTGTTDGFLTDGQCENLTNSSFAYGVSYGMEYAIASITEEVVQCKEIPMEYANYSYTLIAAECLNLNNEEVK